MLVVIDDWKASADAEISPTYFTGRVFLAKDLHVADLYRLLSQAAAEIWHASGPRLTSAFLFTSIQFDEIVEQLGQMRTVLIDMLNTAKAFESPEIVERWNALQVNSEVARTWPKNNAHAIAFFRYVDFLAGFLAELVPKIRARFLVDTMDWLNPGIGEPVGEEPGLQALGWGERGMTAELVMISDKNAAGAKRYLPLLGLVDSEAWAFGRLQSLKFRDGTTVGERLIEWRDRGALRTERVFTDDEYDQLVAPHMNHHQLLRYWEMWAQWGLLGRVVSLAESDSASMQQARAAAVLDLQP